MDKLPGISKEDVFSDEFYSGLEERIGKRLASLTLNNLHYQYDQEGVLPPIDRAFQNQLRDIAQIPEAEEIRTEGNDLLAEVRRPKEGLLYSLLYDGYARLHEYDIAEADTEPTILSKEEHIRIYNESCRALLACFIDHFDPITLSRLFPGVNAENLAEYDFYRWGKIAVAILSFDDFAKFEELFIDEDAGELLSKQGKSTGSSRVWQTPKPEIMGPVKRVNLHGRPFIMIAELIPAATNDQIFRNRRVTSNQRSKMVERSISATIIHEVLHCFDVLEEHGNNAFLEAWVEYLSIYVHSTIYPGLDTRPGYPERVISLKLMLDFLEQSGIPFDRLCRAVLSDDPIRKVQIFNEIADKFGEDVAIDMLRFNFRGYTDVRNFINMLKDDEED